MLKSHFCDSVGNLSVVLFLRYLQLVRGLLFDHSWSGSCDFPACSSPSMEDRGPAEPAQGGLQQRLELWVCCKPRRPGAPPWLCTVNMTESLLKYDMCNPQLSFMMLCFFRVHLLSADFNISLLLSVNTLIAYSYIHELLLIFCTSFGNIAEIFVRCMLLNILPK